MKFRQNVVLHSWSSKVIDLGVNGKLICDFILVINCNFCPICPRGIFEIFRLKYLSDLLYMVVALNRMQGTMVATSDDSARKIK